MTAEAVPLAPAPGGWTIADVDALPDNGLRYELVDGVPRVLNPRTLKHQRAAQQLGNALEQCAPANVSVIGAIGVVLADDQRSVPDVVVLVDDPEDDEKCNVTAEQVLLIAEVVSPSSRSDDRFRKPAQYAEAGIPVYLRVELDPPHVVAYSAGRDGVYVETARAEPGQQLELREPFPISLDPAALLR